MSYKSNRYVPVMLKKAPRRRQNRGLIAALLVLLAVAATAVVLLLQREEKPFSTIVPTATPAFTISAGAEPDSAPSPDVVPESTPGELPQATADSGETAATNPVETVLSAFSQSLQEARSLFDPLAKRNSLGLLSFSLAMDEAGGAALDPLSYFEGLEKGGAPGEWGKDQTTVHAESGSYSFEKVFASGAKISGTVSTAATRLRFDRYAAGSEQPYQSVELIRAASGYYGQVWQQDGLHQTVRFLTAPEGIFCAMSSEKLESIYNDAPVSWDSFSVGCTESLKASAGGALVRVGTKESIYE